MKFYEVKAIPVNAMKRHVHDKFFMIMSIFANFCHFLPTSANFITFYIINESVWVNLCLEERIKRRVSCSYYVDLLSLHNRGGEGRDQKSWKGSAAVANFGKSVSSDLSYDHWQWRLVIWHFKSLIIWQKSDTITTAMVIMENQHIVNITDINVPNLQLLNIWRDELDSEC